MSTTNVTKTRLYQSLTIHFHRAQAVLPHAPAAPPRVSGSRDAGMTSSQDRSRAALIMLERLAPVTNSMREQIKAALKAKTFSRPGVGNYDRALHTLMRIEDVPLGPEAMGNPELYDFVDLLGRFQTAQIMAQRLSLTAYAWDSTRAANEMPVPFNALEAAYSGHWLSDPVMVDPILTVPLPRSGYATINTTLESRWNAGHSEYAQLLGATAAEYGIEAVDVSRSTHEEFSILREALQLDIDALSAQEARWRLFNKHMLRNCDWHERTISAQLAVAIGLTYDMYRDEGGAQEC